MKRSVRNNDGFNDIVYNAEQIKEMFAKNKKCTDNEFIKVKDFLEHPSILEFDDVVKAFETKDEKPSLTILDLPTSVKDSSCNNK